MPSDSRARGAVEHVLALKALPDFADVHPDDLAVLALRATPHRFAAGVALPVAGDGGTVHVLVDGRVRDRSTGERFDAPALLGLADVLAGAVAPTLVSELATTTLAIDRRDLLALLEDEFELWLATFRCVWRRAAAASTWGRPSSVDLVDFKNVPKSTDLSDLAERIAWLRRLPPFEGARIHLLGQIAAELTLFDAEADRVCWEAGETATWALLVADGAIECDGGDATEERRAGTIVGLAEALAGERRPRRARARGRVRGLRLDVEALIDVLEDDPGAAVELLCSVAGHALAGSVA